MERKQLVNGEPIPYDAPLPELEDMLRDKEMRRYCLACEALSWRTDEESFRLLAEQLAVADRWRRLYAFRVIFRSPYAAGLASYAVQQLLSDDPSFVLAALEIIEEHRLPCPEAAMKAAVAEHYELLHDQGKLLFRLEATGENYRYLTELFHREEPCLRQEIVADILLDHYEDSRPAELYALLAGSRYARQRVKAALLAKRRGLDPSALREDPDGHVRKACR